MIPTTADTLRPVTGLSPLSPDATGREKPIFAYWCIIEIINSILPGSYVSPLSRFCLITFTFSNFLSINCIFHIFETGPQFN